MVQLWERHTAAEFNSKSVDAVAGGRISAERIYGISLRC